MRLVQDDFGSLWLSLLEVLRGAPTVRPRDIPCQEYVGVQLELMDVRNNLLYNDVRKLGYRFAVAEWLWIWFGHYDVKTIAQYSPNIAQFSDDGVRFAGAYGPRIEAQWERVMSLLARDPHTRQAVIKIFNSSDLLFMTKDVPCTLSLQFFVRNGRLDTIVTMRSSDAWLGLPYDIYNFSMIANLAAARRGVSLGRLIMNLGSSHLYQSNAEQADNALKARTYTIRSPRLRGNPNPWLDDVLKTKSFNDHKTVMDAREWFIYARVLTAPDNAEARRLLEELSEDDA